MKEKRIVMKTKKYSNYFKTGAFLLVAGLIIASFYYQKTVSDFQIKKFNKVRDNQLILDWFEKDLYWLTNNPEFSPQFMIDHMSPKKDPAFFGKQNIVIVYEKDTPVGFGAYYMKSFYEGMVHFVYIDKNYRRKGYSAKLTQYMIDQLLKMGAKFIKLYTRVNNMPARALYKKLGFKESEPDDQGFVTLTMRK